jgi:hypothetical protein
MKLSEPSARTAAGRCLCAALLAVAPPLNATGSVREGLWEYTARLESSAGSQTLGRERSCRSQNWFDQVAFDTGPVAGCRNQALRRLSDGYAWELRCEDGGRGSVRFKRLGWERVALELAMESPQGAVLLHAESRRIGECGGSLE